MNAKEKAGKILSILKKEFPSAKIALRHSTPLELLVSTILSAQCTDKRVNKTTPTLFKKFKTANDYASADPKELEDAVKSINFFRNKAKSIRACCKKITEKFNGKIPNTVEGLTSLPGVGRKTANIVLANAFDIPALAVDTHVKRVSQRLGLTKNQDPDKIEQDLCKIILKRFWPNTTTLFILHGRKTCKAKNPLCPECPIKRLCEYYKKTTAKK
ncbi:MAG TPA: endonuclease III [Thermodesulfobacteriota bacterium]|nr:endonuclease III [Thermodesulfobacteriota bacterium]